MNFRRQVLDILDEVYEGQSILEMCLEEAYGGSDS